ncbi:MAG: alpha/beta hydrolase [Planctomycetaceae bacterium]|nr:alpha/beta hydrolase [Planctomycetaceae bacterium]
MSPTLRQVSLALFLILLGSTTTHAQLKRVLDPIAAKLEPDRTITYKTIGDRELKLHVFEPEGHQPTDKCPVFLVIHGGGWVNGEPRWFYPIADKFRDRGMYAVSLEYRLLSQGKENTVFDCVKDGRSAVRYLRAHAEELGIDPERIVAAGGSAGGHVAVGTALFDAVNDESDDLAISCRPDLLVLFYPVIDTSEEGYGRQKIGDRWQELSPVDHVQKGLPPTLVFHGTGDKVTPYAGAVEFQKKMQAAGNECKLISHEGGRHGYFIFDMQLYEREMSQVSEFLKEKQFIP